MSQFNQSSSAGWFPSQWFGTMRQVQPADTNGNNAGSQQPQWPMNIVLNMMFPTSADEANSGKKELKNSKSNKPKYEWRKVEEDKNNAYTKYFDQGICEEAVDAVMAHTNQEFSFDRNTLRAVEARLGSCTSGELRQIIMGACIQSSELRCRVVGRIAAIEEFLEIAPSTSQFMTRLLNFRKEHLFELALSIVDTDMTPSTQEVIVRCFRTFDCNHNVRDNVT
ncbi:hypothetical protein F4805DRAFT_454889 [Annulohypoxylon moriforme]|nr:hypothetical protein F4805DRAFT_454889 [Annulohypoxylon moriforme]